MGENITYNDTIGLNEITAQYQSGTYEEIVIIGNQIEVKKKPWIENIVNGKKIVLRDVDRIDGRQNVKITDIGLQTQNPTKVTIESNDISTALWDILPSLLGQSFSYFSCYFLWDVCEVVVWVDLWHLSSHELECMIQK